MEKPKKMLSNRSFYDEPAIYSIQKGDSKGSCRFLTTKNDGVDEPALAYPKGQGLKLKYPRRNTASASKNLFQSCLMSRISSEESDHAIGAKLSNLIR